MKAEDVPYCSNSSGVSMSERLSENLVASDWSRCKCLPSCTKITYQRFDQIVKQPISYNVMKVYYNVPLWRTVREVPLYNTQKFLCDVGSMLCLMLGASVLSLCQCCEWMTTELLLNRR